MKSSKITFSILGFMAFFASLIQNIYTPIIPQLQNDFNVPLLCISSTVGGFIFIIAIVQIILGKYIDSNNPKKMLLIATGITLLSSIVCAFTNIFSVFALFRLLQAVGCGMISLIVITVLANDSTEDNRSSVMANYQIILSCAPALAPIIGGLIGNDYGYHGIFLTLTIVSVIFFVLTYFVNLSKVNSSTNEKISVKYLSFFKSKMFNIMIAFGFLIFFVYFGLLVYLPVLLSEIYSISTGLIGFLFLPITVSIILGSLIYKKLSKKYSNTLLLRLVMLAFPILLIVFSFLNTSNLYVMSINIFLIGIIVGIVPALISTTLSSEFTETKGAALGSFNFIRYIGMALGSIVIGLFSNNTQPYFFIGSSILLLILSLLNWYFENIKVDRVNL